MPELTPVRSSYSFEYKDDPMLFVNIYANHHHHWGLKHASSYVLVEGTEGAAIAQIGDNLLCGKDADGKLDYLHVKFQFPFFFVKLTFFLFCFLYVE
jgi:hypothetical protein